jgi:phosphoribosyl-dephospho-CoA transferase
MIRAMPGPKEIYASVKTESQKITALSNIPDKQIPDSRWKLMDLDVINFIKENISPSFLFLSNDYRIEDILPAYTNNKIFLSK